MKNAGVQRMGVGGGGCLGVAQVVLAVSIEGSRGSRICGEGAARRGHGGWRGCVQSPSRQLRGDCALF